MTTAIRGTSRRRGKIIYNAISWAKIKNLRKMSNEHVTQVMYNNAFKTMHSRQAALLGKKRRPNWAVVSFGNCTHPHSPIKDHC